MLLRRKRQRSADLAPIGHARQKKRGEVYEGGMKFGARLRAGSPVRGGEQPGKKFNVTELGLGEGSKSHQIHASTATFAGTKARGPGNRAAIESMDVGHNGSRTWGFLSEATHRLGKGRIKT